jgi:hypothetical protein
MSALIRVIRSVVVLTGAQLARARSPSRRAAASASIDEVRELVGRSFTTKTYEPGARALWDEAYARLERVDAVDA